MKAKLRNGLTKPSKILTLDGLNQAIVLKILIVALEAEVMPALTLELTVSLYSLQLHLHLLKKFPLNAISLLRRQPKLLLLLKRFQLNVTYLRKYPPRPPPLLRRSRPNVTSQLRLPRHVMFPLRLQLNSQPHQRKSPLSAMFPLRHQPQCSPHHV